MNYSVTAVAALATCIALVSMPSSSPAGPVSGLMSAPFAQLPPGEEVPADDIGQLNGYISTPAIRRPYFICADQISVSGVLPNATLDFEAEIQGQSMSWSHTIVEGGVLAFDLSLPFTTTSDWIRVRQGRDGDTSDWDAAAQSGSNRAHDVSEIYPNGLPVPTLYYPPFYECGQRTGLTNFVSGAKVSAWLNAQTGAVRLWGPKTQSGHAQEGFSSVAITLGDELSGSYDFCGATEVSVPGQYFAQELPLPLPPLEIQPVYEDSERVTVTNVTNGAAIRLEDINGTIIGKDTSLGGLGFIRPYSWARPLQPGQTLFAYQEFPNCGSSPNTSAKSDPATVAPCSDLPAPRIERPSPDDDYIRVTKSEPGAVIFVADENNNLIGKGLAPVVGLSRPLVTAEPIRVIQVLGPCESSTAYQIQVDCGPKGRNEFKLLGLLKNRRYRSDLSNYPPSAAQCQ